jgi:hypothetical protein
MFQTTTSHLVKTGQQELALFTKTSDSSHGLLGLGCGLLLLVLQTSHLLLHRFHRRLSRNVSLPSIIHTIASTLATNALSTARTFGRIHETPPVGGDTIGTRLHVFVICVFDSASKIITLFPFAMGICFHFLGRIVRTTTRHFITML